MSAADVIGILSFAFQVVSKVHDVVQGIRKAPEEIQILEAEVVRVQTLLERVGIRDAIDQSEGKASDELKLLLELGGRGEELMAATNLFIQKVTKVADNGTRRVKKTKWPFKSSEARELAEEFKAFHRALTDICAINTFTRVRSMESTIVDVGDRTISALDQRVARVEELLSAERIEQILIRSLTAVSHQQRKGHHQHFDELSPLRGGHEIDQSLPEPRLSSAGSDAARYTYSLPGESSSSMATAPFVTPTLSTSVASHSLHQTTLPQPLPSSYMRGPPWRRCPSGCRCRCHKQSSDYRLIPPALRSWLGDIHIPKTLITSLISSTCTCDDAKCARSAQDLSVVKWYLPTLFAQVHAEVTFQSFPVHFVIQTPRVVNSLYFLFNMSLDELKMKLYTRELTVNDVQGDGFTVLHFAALMIAHQRPQAYDVMHHLIDAGAPQDWEYREQTVTEYMANMGTRWFGPTSAASTHLRSFENNITKPLLQEDMEDAWDRIRVKRNWSDLHYLLANPPRPSSILNGKLATVLRHSNVSFDLNAKDDHSVTPLLQAIYSCPEAVDALLRAGANPHLIVGSLGNAIETHSWRSISPLVRAGADANAYYDRYDGTTSTALHNVVRIESALGPGARLPCAVELVRHAGHMLDWAVRDERGKIPLVWSWWDFEEYPHDEDVVSIFHLYRTRKLPLGVQLIDGSRLGEMEEAVVHLESMSLIEAALAGNVGVIGKLINAGAMVNERDASGRTLLHLVAMGVVPNGYTIALELVRHGGYGVHWDVLTVDGETAEDLAKETLEHSTAPLDPEDEQHEDYSRILRLLQRRVLPGHVEHIYPCMHADYCRACSARPCSGYCSNGLRMPGGFSQAMGLSL